MSDISLADKQALQLTIKRGICVRVMGKKEGSVRRDRTRGRRMEKSLPEITKRAKRG